MRRMPRLQTLNFTWKKADCLKKNHPCRTPQQKIWNVTCCLQRVARRSADSSIVGYFLRSEKNVVRWNRFGRVVAKAPPPTAFSSQQRKEDCGFFFFWTIVFPAFFCCQRTKIQQSVYILRRFCYCLKLVVHICYVVNWNAAQDKFMFALWVM